MFIKKNSLNCPGFERSWFESNRANLEKNTLIWKKKSKNSFSLCHKRPQFKQNSQNVFDSGAGKWVFFLFKSASFDTCTIWTQQKCFLSLQCKRTWKSENSKTCILSLPGSARHRTLKTIFIFVLKEREREKRQREKEGGKGTERERMTNRQRERDRQRNRKRETDMYTSTMWQKYWVPK